MEYASSAWGGIDAPAGNEERYKDLVVIEGRVLVFVPRCQHDRIFRKPFKTIVLQLML